MIDINICKKCNEIYSKHFYKKKVTISIPDHKGGWRDCENFNWIVCCINGYENRFAVNELNEEDIPKNCPFRLEQIMSEL